MTSKMYSLFAYICYIHLLDSFQIPFLFMVVVCDSCPELWLALSLPLLARWSRWCLGMCPALNCCQVAQHHLQHNVLLFVGQRTDVIKCKSSHISLNFVAWLRCRFTARWCLSNVVCTCVVLAYYSSIVCEDSYVLYTKERVHAFVPTSKMPVLVSQWQNWYPASKTAKTFKQERY